MEKVKSLLFWLVCAAGIIVLQVGFLFFLLGFLPTIVTYFVDDSPKKNFYKTVRACNFAGMLPTLARLIEHKYPAAELQIQMSDPVVWLTIYAAAGGGWILVWLCRWASYLAIIATSDTRIIMMEKMQRELVNEWGDGITNRAHM